MAAPISVDFGEAGEGGKVGNKSLAVNKSSTKIKKGLRPMLAQPRLAPTVYKTEPSDFRSLVQKLTGTSQTIATSPPCGPKPPNSRLQRIAPPPLRPTSTYLSFGHSACPSQSACAQLESEPVTYTSPSGNQLFPLSSFSSLPKHVTSPFPVSPLSFSPLPQLSPSDQGWVNSLNGLESPGSVVIRQLAQSIVEGNVLSSKQEQATRAAATATSSLPPVSPNFSSLRFSSSAFGLLSPSGFPSPSRFGFGLGNVYGISGSFTPSAALSMDATFSFPEPDIAMSPTSIP
ncbi:hypothetical protein KC19_VG133700 [Ceratodon purpureus]|uniref:VQ domain-containing protein n=1 Tax=Ceratodon purpureus TaxID=3225 RepID=A0A8T0HQS4_CERPU|nr:hypothetical protein KC19_VG133700 [Ceratodon purpureus]